MLTGSDTSIGDEFGTAVAISGNTIAVGARLHDGGGNNAGAIYMFERDPDTKTWTESLRIEGGYGGLRLTDTSAPSRGLALDGDQMIAAAWDGEISYRYRRTGEIWSLAGDVNAKSAVSAGGGTIAASQNESGHNPGYADVFRCADLDTDGDGLLDKWETEGGGYDVNLDGVVDISLFERGARPDRKDLFYEIDKMVGVNMDSDAIVDVIEAFALAPVPNPDGSTGISLHFDLLGIDDIPFDSSWDDFGTEFAVTKDLYWGTASERVDPNADAILEAKRDIYRYAVIANQINDGALGIAETPGDDLICAFGQLLGDRTEQANTLMHEIGHNLNLGHGGVVQDDGPGPTRLGDQLPLVDHTNFKPNYVSVMNYAFSEIRDADGNPLMLDFSREQLQTLDESRLDESMFIDSALYDGVWVLHGYEGADEMRAVGLVKLGSSSVDWNRDNQIDQGVELDINWLGEGYPANEASPGEVLRGCNDWEAVVLRFTDSMAYERSQHIAPSAYDEITYDELVYMRKNTPPIPGLCSADLNKDGELNFFDVSAFLTTYSANDLSVDFTGDGSLNFFDVSAFLTAYSAGCP